MSLREPRGTVRRKQGGGGWLGAILGGGITGGDFVPPEIIEPAGPTPTGEPLRPQVTGKPSFTRPQAQNPTLDAIFNRGQNSYLAAQMNAAQQQALFNAAMQEQIAQLANTGAIDVAQLQGQNRLGEIKESGNVAIKTGDAKVLQDQGLPSSMLQQWTQGPAANILKQRENESGTLANFTGTDKGRSLMEQNYTGRMQAPMAENMAKTSHTISPGNLLYQGMGADGTQPGNPYITPGLIPKETVEMVGGITDPKTGQVFGAQPKSTTSYEQKPAYSPMDIQRKEEEIRRRIAEAELTNKPNGNPSIPVVQPKPSGPPIPKNVNQLGSWLMNQQPPAQAPVAQTDEEFALQVMQEEERKRKRALMQQLIGRPAPMMLPAE
jgi:hypothetical protein